MNLGHVSRKVCYGLDGTTEFGLPCPASASGSSPPAVGVPAREPPFEHWTRTAGPGPTVKGGPVPLTGTMAERCEPGLKGKGTASKPAKRRPVDPAAFDAEAYAFWCRSLFGKDRKDRTTHGRALQEFGTVFKSLAQDLLVANDAPDPPPTTDEREEDCDKDGLDSDASESETQPVTESAEVTEAAKAGTATEVPQAMVDVKPATAVLVPTTVAPVPRYITLKDMRKMRDGVLPNSLSYVLRVLSRHVFASEHDLCKAVEVIEVRQLRRRFWDPVLSPALPPPPMRRATCSKMSAHAGRVAVYLFIFGHLQARCDAFVVVKKDRRKRDLPVAQDEEHICRICKKHAFSGVRPKKRDAQIAKHKEEGCHPPLPPGSGCHPTPALAPAPACA